MTRRRTGAALAEAGLGARIYEGSLIIGLLRLRDGMRLFFRPILREYQLTDQNWRIIKVLGETGPTDMTQLGLAAVIPPASASRIVTRMEAGGLLKRRADGADRRQVRVELTAKGKRLYAKVAPLIRRTYSEIAGLLDPRLLATLDSTVRALNEQIAAAGLPAADEDD